MKHQNTLLLDLATPFEECIEVSLEEKLENEDSKGSSLEEYPRHPLSHPWDEYPRPQFRRDSYFPLNGEWDLAVLEETSGKETPVGKIQVPYVPESRLGGIRPVGSQTYGPIITEEDPHGRSILPNEKWVYQKRLELPEIKEEERLILNIGAADQIASVYINGHHAATHQGGYLPFSVDITNWIREKENDIRIEVQDALDPDLPYGKQRKDRGGMWYTPYSGIWQSVFLEVVPKMSFRKVQVITTLNSVTFQIEGGKNEKCLILQQDKDEWQPEFARQLQDGARQKVDEENIFHFAGNTFTLPIQEPHLWTVEDPYLYRFTLTDGEDTIHSYFALRTFEVKNGKFWLNGNPIFLHGLLDQGFYSDGICLPASPKGYTFDIQTMKNLGFNLLRKHIKLESERFYYDCDRLGMLVMQDLVNSGPYDFFTDTLLPTVGVNSVLKKKPSLRRQLQFEQDAFKTLEHLHNHPSVIGYTIFNEGWGEYRADAFYLKLKKADPSRFYDAASGWFNGKNSDVISRHVYFKKLKLSQFKSRQNETAGTPEISTRALFLSEFGGYSCPIPGHVMNQEKAYGYKKIQDTTSLTRELTALYKDQVIPLIQQGLAGCILTQVSDVEDEINGLVTYDRQVVKVEESAMKETAALLYKTFQEAIQA